LALFLAESPEPVTAQVIKTALVNIAPQHQRGAVIIQARGSSVGAGPAVRSCRRTGGETR
jgi:hypothetical protein